MRSVCIVFLLILLPWASSAQSNIFEILDDQFITSISELPYSPGIPEIRSQTYGNIQGWIDIVGFRNMSFEDGHFKINGLPEKLAIIQYDAYGSPPGIQDSITKSVSFSRSGNNLTATLNVIMKWHTVYCDSNGCFVSGRLTSTAKFQDVEPLPEQFNETLGPVAKITEYNNSINPHTVIDLQADNLTYINYYYNNNSIRNYRKVARVDRTEKGVYFANLTAVNIWSQGTEYLHQMNNEVIIPGTSNPDYQKLSIEVSNLYETKTVSDYAITRDTYTVERSFSKLYLAVLSTASILVIMIFSITRRIF